MLEDDLLKTILEMCRLLHLRTAHFRPALTAKGWRTPVQGDGKGFLDLIIVGRGLLVRELKRDGQIPDAEQKAWIAAFTGAGVDVGVWREMDLRSGRIWSELKAVA